MIVPEETMQRLGFVRYLFELGVEQSRAPEPYGAAAVLTFHDSVEMFLQVASEQVNKGVPRPNFMDYFDVLDSGSAPISLSQKESMRRMNKSRVALKHHGTLPSKLDIESFRATTKSFFEENTLQVFGMAFSQVSLAFLVTTESVRELLLTAENALANDAHEEAINCVAEAFARLLYEYGLAAYPLVKGPMVVFTGSSTGNPEYFGLERGMDNLQRSVAELEYELQAVRHGIDVRRLAIFTRLTPVVEVVNGLAHTFITRKPIPANDERARFCYHFAVESALKLQQASTFSHLLTDAE